MATLPMAGASPTRGLSRAALVMLGASMAVTACGSPPTPPPPDTPVSPDAPADPVEPSEPDDDGAAAAEYGAPMPVDEPDETTGPPDDGGGMMPKYGAPPPQDP